MRRLRSQEDTDAGLAENILLWVTLAKRPLLVSELQHALALNLNEDDDSDDDARQISDDQLADRDSILSVCAGLVAITSTELVQFVHYTVQEHFKNCWKDEFPQGPTTIMQTCAKYLMLYSHAQTIPDDAWTKKNTLHFERARAASPLTGYARKFLVEHTRELPEFAPVRVLAELLDYTAALSFSKQAIILPFGAEDFEIVKPVEPAWGSRRPPFYSNSAPVLAARYGIRQVLEHFAKDGRALCSLDQNKLSPLAAAVWAGSYDEANMLLSHSSNYWIEPLREDIFQFLVRMDSPSSPGVSVLAGNLIGQITFQSATERDTHPPIRNPQWPPYTIDPRGGIYLLRAVLLEGKRWETCLFGDILPHLREAIDAQDNEGRTMLMLSLALGWTRIIHTVIRCEPDLSIRDKRGRTAIFYAVMDLDDSGIDPGAIADYEPTDKSESLKLLARLKADVNAQDSNGRTALSFVEDHG
ncbi:hypothetical protein VMCG_01781 [Cytospora schulzeri]|uniref:GPI inositol-deacylase winged helix domain-containing protein n=1 Tax=Cytospora schulzeri TaxID=448051 RepID=A0A423X3E3_9PEZI|nr:hypothetical protein VMCG_01781 [Valsa malicola]